MQVDWSLSERWERSSKEAERNGDSLLADGDVQGAWRQYLQGSEFARMADQPKEGIRLAELALGLTLEGSEPASVTKLHVSGCLSAMGNITEGVRCLDQVENTALSPALTALYHDIRFGHAVLMNDREGCLRGLDGLDRCTHSTAQLSALFRRAEWVFLLGEMKRFQGLVEQVYGALKSFGDNGAGIAAISVLEGEAAACRGDWARAESSYAQAIEGYTRCGRLGPILSVWGRLAWVYYESGQRLPVAPLQRARSYCERFELHPLRVGMDLALGIMESDVQGLPRFEAAWTYAEGFQLNALSARARYLFARRFPHHQERGQVLEEALVRCGLSRPLEVLIKAEMC